MSQTWKVLLLTSWLGACSGADADADAGSGASSVSGGASGTTRGTGGASVESTDISSSQGATIPGGATGGAVAANVTGDVPTRSAGPGGAGASAADSDMASAASSAVFVSFVDPDTGFQTNDVFDADREIVHFDSRLGSMVWSASGDSVSGWAVTGTALRWSASGVAFRVSFGTEAGQRRAFFTEAGPGTICNLSITAPESLSIRATDETPPDA